MGALAAVLFAVAAVIGATMAAQRLRGVERPATGVALAHGAFAAVALVLLIVFAATTEVAGTMWWAVGLFVVAALGGAALFLGFHLRERALPVPMVFVHGGVAVVGFVLLLVALLT